MNAAQKTVNQDMFQQIRSHWLRAVHAMDPVIQKNIGWPGTSNCCPCQQHDSDFWVQVFQDNSTFPVTEVAILLVYQNETDLDPAIKLTFDLPQIGKQKEVENFELQFPTVNVSVHDAIQRVVEGLVRYCELVWWDIRAQDSRTAWLEANVPDYAALFPVPHDHLDPGDHAHPGP